MAVAALLTAGLFYALNLPLPWLLGPMLSTVLLKLKYPAEVKMSLKLRNLFLIPLGYNIGANITIEACHEIVAQFAGISLSTLTSVFVCLILAWWTSRATGVSYASSAIGNMPGGLTPMLLICESIPKADINVVVVLQTIRLMATIAVVPFLLAHGFGTSGDLATVIDMIEVVKANVPAWQLVLVAVAGAVIGYIFNLPAQFLLGPIITTGIFAIYTGLPLPEVAAPLIAVAQIVTGVYLGTCIDPFQLSKNTKLLPVALVGVIVIIATSFVTGYFLSQHYGFTVATAFLGCAPGGIAEMCITGMVMGEDVTIILAYQLFRLLFLNLVMPVTLKWYFSRQP